MALLERRCQPLARCARCAVQNRTTLPIRSFTTSSTKQDALDNITTAADRAAPPSVKTHRPERLVNIVHSPKSERRLVREHGLYPVGSRRRRAAIATGAGIPFHQLPYQCFQEARKYLQEDRQEKVEEIEYQRRRIEDLKTTIAKSGSQWDDSQRMQQEHRLRSMKKRLDDMKILADINDPIVKKNFEDGFGDMNKPIYRHLSDLKWRTYKRKVLMQRITQMNVVPDILPHIDPIVSTSLSFGGKNIQHGDIVISSISEQAPVMEIQPYDKGDRYVTIAFVNPDVPNVSKDGFDYRCHFLASNIRISPTQTRVELANLDPETQIIQDWLPAYAQKGLPYQRMGIFILEQEEFAQDPAILEETLSLQTKLATLYNVSASTPPNPAAEPAADSNLSSILPVPTIKSAGRYTARPGFILRSFSTKYNLKAVGVDMFRTQWDEGTAGVMQRADVPGWDVEFKRKRTEPLPYHRLKSERYR